MANENNTAATPGDEAERSVIAFTLTFERGLTHARLADELERIARLVREDFQQGEVNRDTGRGWWLTL